MNEEIMKHIAKATGAFKVGQQAPPVSASAPHTNGASKGEPETAVLLNVSHVQKVVDTTLRLGGGISIEQVRELIVDECRLLEALLLEKNDAYGNSALAPLRLFSHASPIEQLKVRIDDKLSRISRGDFSKVKEEDLRVVTKDLLGYLILIRVAWRLGLE